ncbi:hypothetical protein NIASO_02545 [Niabella soli DSM 19437]|uniref:Uncharacterized protein n=1 Tax=Niabella soli DSM 19437 TaxID=929713 RepID=W0F721_9BACT|nr:hypothetical protein NIASO_02545 [Niabella soli DSM 19437]
MRKDAHLPKHYPGKNYREVFLLKWILGILIVLMLLLFIYGLTIFRK